MLLQNDSDTASIHNTVEKPSIPSPFLAVKATDTERIQQLEGQLETLQDRIEKLEDILAGTLADAETETQAQPIDEQTVTRDEASVPVRALSLESLLRAGIDESTAGDIIRRTNEIDLARLELRDRASREGYLGTRRYNSELAKLTAGEISLRDELGEAAYDRYLYATGQTNRVKVASVMAGSAAELAGMMSGDLILSYNGERVFKWVEVQQATTGGVLGDYVTVGIQRDGAQFNLWLPRGPLGVRLDATRLNPDN